MSRFLPVIEQPPPPPPWPSLLVADENSVPRFHLNDWQKSVFNLAKEKGWHDGPDGKEVDHREPERMAARIANIHAELSEALECVRNGDRDLWDGVDGKPEGLAIELADVAIRLLDFCESLGIDLEGAMVRKHSYNATRSRRHGGKLV
jgi:NTP pyrophosphatase (non-canonical NTP hydrolase)